jgi:hypothetical protein
MVGMGTVEARHTADALMDAQEETINMTDQDGPAFCEIIKRLLDDAQRDRAIEFLTKCSGLPPGLDFTKSECVKLLLPKGELKTWMIACIDDGNKDGLLAWNAIVRVLGDTLHQQGDGTSLLNSLLQVVEKAFKHSANHIRKCAYQSWMVLMDNFATNQAVLASSKRVKLIVRPLIVSDHFHSNDQCNNLYINRY